MSMDGSQAGPSLPEICNRIQALSAVLYRAQLEMGGHSVDQLRHWFGDLKKWIERDDLSDHFSASESQLMEIPLGGWGQTNVLQTIGRFEALVTLLWAIKRIDEMPSWQVPVGAKMMENAALFKSPKELLELGVKRDDVEIETMQQAAEFWHWRFRTEMMRRGGAPPPAGETYEDCISKAVDHAMNEGIISNSMDGDIEINGTAYGSLNQEDWANVASISIERHFGFNWLAGRAENNDWDLTRVDT